MLSKTFRVRLRSFHRWFGILIGVQLLLWVLSGVYFAWISIEDIRGDTNKAEIQHDEIAIAELFSPASLQLPLDFRFKALKLEASPSGYIYRVESWDDEIRTFSARSGEALPLLSPEQASRLGLSQVKKEAKILATNLVDEKGGEYKGPVPAYRVQLDDTLSTRLYLDPWSGKLIVQRNALWRVYDFLWMLHIMDYSERENFNNPWIKAASLAGLSIIISGYLLFIFGRPARRKSLVKSF